MANKEENVTDRWLRPALMIASKVNEETFREAFKAKGLNLNPSLLEASLAQRLAFGSRITTIPLRRTAGFGGGGGGNRQGAAAAPLTPEMAGREIFLSGDIEWIAPRQFGGGGRGAGAAAATPPAQPAAPATQATVPYYGLLVAQGNKTNGYGMYFMDNKIFFQVNQDGKSYQIAPAASLPAKFSFKAGLQKNGTMRLLINDKEVGTAKTPGLFKKDLELPVRVGTDTAKGNGKVANYPDSNFALRGANLLNGKLETLEGTLPVPPVGKVSKVIVMKVLRDVMKYDKALITAKAGTTIQIVLQNPDVMQHNLVLIKPKTTAKVGAAADELARDPNGAKMNYVPKMPEVLAATPLINPGGKFTLNIKLPAVPGDYPYVCTFPGHWRIMKGILRVSK